MKTMAVETAHAIRHYTRRAVILQLAADRWAELAPKRKDAQDAHTWALERLDRATRAELLDPEPQR